jgi:peptide/nickel transport system permease protein
MQGFPGIASRFVHTLLVLWAVATILFLIFRLMPGSPLAAYIDPTFTAEQQETLLRSFGLDRLHHEHYVIFLGNLLQGDLGQSFFYKRPVGEVIMAAFPNTIALTLSSLILAYVFGVMVGAARVGRATCERAQGPLPDEAAARLPTDLYASTGYGALAGCSAPGAGRRRPRSRARRRHAT